MQTQTPPLRPGAFAPMPMKENAGSPNAMLAMPPSSARAADDGGQRASKHGPPFLADRAERHTDTGKPVLDAAGRPAAGRFKLVYRFKWEDLGITDVAYVCCAEENVYDTTGRVLKLFSTSRSSSLTRRSRSWATP